MVKQGMIGDVHFVRAFWYRNSTDDNPAWRYAIPPDANEQNTDWPKFLGPAPQRAWDPHRYYQWRLYWDYSGGISTDLLVHQTDIVNFMLDRTVPLSCMASGGIYRWTGADDDRDTPDTFSAIYEYPASCRSTIPAISATINTATASSCAATKAPSKCSTAWTCTSRRNCSTARRRTA
jgi:predicted dehydrogenase